MSTPVSRTVNIYINQASAEAALLKLQTKADALTVAIGKGRMAGKDMSAEIAKLADLQPKIQSLSDVVSGKLQPTFTQVKSRVSELRRELEAMSKDAPGYAQKFEDFQKVTERFEQMKVELKGVNQALEESGQKSNSFFSDLKNQVKAVALGTIIGNTVQAATETVSGYFSSLINGNAGLSDSLAAVRRTTGLTDIEVKALNKDLKSIDTRTARSELLSIAEIGGQFNVAKEDLKGFITQIDKANVVLGSEFGGGAEQITTELALLRNVFTDIKSDHIDEDLGHIGNALVTLAQEGAATGPVVSDFSKRLSPLISTAKVSTSVILGLGATMQELAINPERGGTAVVKLFDKMTSNAAAFAKVAGIGIEDFKKQLQTDSFSAFLKVLEGFKKGGDNVLALSGILGELEISGVGAKEVLVKLSDNVGMLQQRTELAGDALQKTDKITEQFNISNNTMGGDIEKLSKRFSSFMTSPAINNFLAGAVTGATKFLNVAEHLAGFISDNIVAFGLWSAAILVNTKAYSSLVAWISQAILGIKNGTLAQIASTIATKAEIVATTALSAVKALLSGNMAKVRQELALLKVAMGTNPLGILLIAAGALVIAYNQLIGKSAELTSAQKVQIEMSKQIVENSATELTAYEALKTKIQNTALSEDTRRKAALEMQKMYPTILGNLSAEEILAGKVGDAYKRISDMILTRVTSKVYEDRLGKITAALIDVETQLEKAPQLDKFRPHDIQGNALHDLPFNIPTPGIDAAATGVDVYNMRQYNKLLAEQNDIRAKLNAELVKQQKLATPAPAPVAEVEQQVATLASLKQKLQELKDVRENLAITDTKALASNLAQQKDLQEQIDNLEGKEPKNKKKIDPERNVNELRDYVKKFSEGIQKSVDDTYQREIDFVLQSANLLREQLSQDYLDGIASKKQYSDGIKKIDSDETAERMRIAKEFGDLSTKAATDYENDKTEGLKQQVKIRINLTEEEKALQEFTTSKATPNSDAALEGIKRRIELEYELQIAAAKKLNKDIAELEADKNRDLQAADIQYWTAKLDLVLGFAKRASSVIDGFFAAQNEKENSSLNEDKAVNDQKKAQLQDALDKKRISQETYNREIQKLDADYAKKEHEIQVQQFKRNQESSLIQAAINGAMGVTQIWSQYAAMPYIAAALTAIEVAAVGVEIAKIKAQKPPVAAYAKGTDNAKGGLSLVSELGPEIGRTKSGEWFVTPDTPSLVDIPAGSQIIPHDQSFGQPTWINSMPSRINYQKVAQTMMSNQIQGSYASNRNTTFAQDSSQVFNEELVNAMKAFTAQLKEGVNASIYWNEWDKKNRQAEAIKTAGSKKP